MLNNERDFKGVWIPKEVWLDTRLNALEKCIFVEVDSLDSEESGCYASNSYLANFCQCSEAKVSKAISKLIELGYIFVQSFNGRQRILKSKFTKNCKAASQKVQGSLVKNTRQPSKKYKADLEKIQGNNIIYNNNIINKINNKNNNKYIVGQSHDIATKIINYLNEKAGTHFKPVDSNIKFITARLKDYNEQDLKAVIDKKVKEWRGTKMQPYLRPETLFNATKFESYINGLDEAVSKVEKQRADYDSSSFDL